MTALVPAQPVPLGPLIRLDGPAALAGDATVHWNDGALVLRSTHGEKTLRPLTRDQLLSQFRPGLIGDAESGWLVSDGRLMLIRPDGVTVTVTPDPSAVDQAVRLLMTASDERAVAGTCP